jgi:hypothetical protein
MMAAKQDDSNDEIASRLPWRIAMTVAILGTGLAALADLLH